MAGHLDPGSVDSMVEALGTYAMRMTRTAIEFRDEMSDAAVAEFDRIVSDWMAVAGEWVSVPEMENADAE